MSGAVDRYLDTLFDRLAGTGSAGRRALAEAEDHLRAATAAAMDRGLSADEAEREAVTRFGPASLIARQVRHAHPGGRLNRALSSAWLLAGLAMAGLGGCYLSAAARLAVLAATHPDCRFYLTLSCMHVAPLAGQAAWTGAIILGIGLGLIGLREVAVRTAGLAVTVRRLACRRVLLAAAIVLLAVTGFAFTGLGVDHAVGVSADPSAVSDPLVRMLGLATSLVAGCLAIAAFVAAAAVSLVRSGRTTAP
jgi:hypothetical protein